MKKYKYKLNMLEAGLKMIKAISILIAIGIVFYIFKVFIICYIASGIAALIGLVLWILLMIESHQDKVLNEQAIQERRENGEE